MIVRKSVQNCLNFENFMLTNKAVIFTFMGSFGGWLRCQVTMTQSNDSLDR